MTIRELIYALKEIAMEYDDGMDMRVVLGSGFDENDKLETLSLQAEPRNDENILIFEEEFTGDTNE